MTKGHIWYSSLMTAWSTILKRILRPSTLLWGNIMGGLVSYCCFNKLQKFGGSKHHKFILFPLWGSKVQHRSHWATKRCQRGCSPSGGSGENPFPCPFPLLEADHIPWWVVSSSISKARDGQARPSPPASLRHRLPCFPLAPEGPLRLHWALLPQIIQHHLPIARPLS